MDNDPLNANGFATALSAWTVDSVAGGGSEPWPYYGSSYLAGITRGRLNSNIGYSWIWDAPTAPKGIVDDAIAEHQYGLLSTVVTGVMQAMAIAVMNNQIIGTVSWFATATALRQRSTNFFLGLSGLALDPWQLPTGVVYGVKSVSPGFVPYDPTIDLAKVVALTGLGIT